MLHPIFSTVIQRPDLIAEHVSAYCDVISQDARTVGSQFAKRAIAGLVAVICGSIFILMVGMAVMLGTTLNQFHWSQVVVPGIALVITAGAAFKAIQPLAQDNFADLKAQLKNDVSALRMAS